MERKRKEKLDVPQPKCQTNCQKKILKKRKKRKEKQRKEKKRGKQNKKN